MTDLAKLTWPEAMPLFDARTIAIVPIGTTEPHGPHLPLDADITIALAMARRAAERLEALGQRALVTPAIPFGVTNYTEGFAGRITIQPGTLWALVEDVIVALEQQGIRRVVLANGHLEPAHVQVLRGVVLDHAGAKPDKARAIFPDNTRRRWAETLGDEFKSGDCHAGRYETSLVLAHDRANVREDAARALPPVKVDLIAKMKSGVSSFADAGAEHAYCGDPAAGTVEEGHDLVDRLATMLVESAREAWPDLGSESEA